MSENTAISWTDHTINLWWGCTKKSPGCKNCYADTFSKRWGKDIWGPGKPREDHRENAIKTALKLNREAERVFERYEHRDISGSEFPWDNPIPQRPRVFSASMSDWLDDEVPIEWLEDLLELIAATPNLDWLLLTKRPENWYRRISLASGDMAESWIDCVDMPERGTIPENVWIGTTVENQEMADERIPELLKIPAKVRFLSCEPLLEAVRLRDSNAEFGDGSLADLCDAPDGWDFCHGVHWVICGGESGPRFRQFNPAWARSLRDQCQTAGVAFHMKQMGGLKPSMMPPIPEDLMIRNFPNQNQNA